MTDKELCEMLRLWNQEDAADRIEALVRERDEWKSLAEAVIADDASKNIHYAEVQHRAEAAEAALKAINPAAIREAALREAHDAIADYPRVAPDGTEAQHYDEQIEYSQSIILALIDKKEG